MKDHYTTLDLSSKRLTALSARDVKSAYRSALLRHHPDKAVSSAPTPTPTPTPSGATSATIGTGPPVPRGPERAVASPGTRNDRTPAGRGSGLNPHVTIDEITEAYTTLVDPGRKAAYDVELARYIALSRTTTGAVAAGVAASRLAPDGFRSAESVDLDDLRTEVAADGRTVWLRACRCQIFGGREFVISEQDLDLDAADPEGTTGEVLVCCRGCSLCLRVAFAVLELDA